jgi:zinc protease
MRLTLHTTLPAVALAALAVACAPAAPVTAPAPALDRAAPPAPLPERPIEFPDFYEFTLPNGLPVIVLEHPGQPLANINLYVRSGTALDPAEQAGRAGLTAELLTKGTERRSATDISRTIEGVGGTLSTKRRSGQPDHLEQRPGRRPAARLRPALGHRPAAHLPRGGGRP